MKTSMRFWAWLMKQEALAKTTPTHSKYVSDYAESHDSPTSSMAARNPPVLECAMTGHGDVIVTGDRAMLNSLLPTCKWRPGSNYAANRALQSRRVSLP